MRSLSRSCGPTGGEALQSYPVFVQWRPPRPIITETTTLGRILCRLGISASAHAALWHGRRTTKGEGRAAPLSSQKQKMCVPPSGKCSRSALAGDSDSASSDREMDACACALELLAMLLYVGAWLCALATTILPQWLTMSTALLPIESYELGLWETCVVQEMGGMECRPYDSLLGLSSDLKLARVLMCACLAVGVLGILAAVPGLYLVNSCKDGTKRTFTVLGGVLGMISGVLCLIPVSYMAHLAIVQFFDERVPDVVPRWEFGDALFCGWAGGFLLIVAGLLLVASGACPQAEAQPVGQQRYQAMNAAWKPRKRSEYV